MARLPKSSRTGLASSLRFCVNNNQVPSSKNISALDAQEYCGVDGFSSNILQASYIAVI